jgi:transposase-like protein
MRDAVRYSEAFKLRLVEDVAMWIKQYGREDILPKRVKVETTGETDGMKAARNRIRELETASADGTCRRAYGLLP